MADSTNAKLEPTPEQEEETLQNQLAKYDGEADEPLRNALKVRWIIHTKGRDDVHIRVPQIGRKEDGTPYVLVPVSST